MVSKTAIKYSITKIKCYHEVLNWIWLNMTQKDICGTIITAQVDENKCRRAWQKNRKMYVTCTCISDSFGQFLSLYHSYIVFSWWALSINSVLDKNQNHHRTCTCLINLSAAMPTHSNILCPNWNGALKSPVRQLD